MAAIGSIRKHSTLLIILIGGAMALFVLGDMLSSQSVFFNGPNDEVGDINGNKITYAEFERRVKEMEEMTNSPVDEQMRNQIRDQVWNQMVRENVVLPEYDALGLKVTDEEILYIIKNDPNNPSLRQYFTDPNTNQIIEQFMAPGGGLDGSKVIAYLKQYVFTDDPNAAEAKSNWLNFQENYLRKPLLDKKYFALIGKGIYVTDVELEDAYHRDNDIISFNYVAALYNSIADSTVEVTDADLKAYYEEHKNEKRFYQKEPMRSLSFITFDVFPTTEDKDKLMDELNALKEAFKNADDDTLFVNENADTPFNIKWVTAGTFPADVDTMIMNAEVNDVIGPFENRNEFDLVKVLDHKVGADSVKASHILLRIDGDTAKAEAIADSLIKEIDNGADFAALAQRYSADQGSAEKGGDLGWFTEGRMVEEFNDYCFSADTKAGDVGKVTTRFGIHIIRIDEKTAPVEKVLVAIVDNTIEPSDETYEKVYNEASSFAINNNTMEKFLDAGSQYAILQAPSLRPTDMTMMGMENTRQIIRWAFQSSVGDVSQVFTVGDQYVVAVVTDARDKGQLAFDDVVNEIRPDVIREKKAEKLMAEMEGQTDLNALASRYNTGIQPANDVNFGSFSIPGMGPEQKLLGLAFTLENGDVSTPIDGQRAVYVIQILNKMVPAEAKIDPGVRLQLAQEMVMRVNYQLVNALEEKAEIEDNRIEFY